MTQEDGATPTGGVVLVTGAASLWGQRLAARLAGRDSYRVIGLDREPLPADGPPLDFVQADVRNPALGALLASEGVRTVCHLASQESTVPNPAAFDYNVQGTMHLLQACAGAGVAQVVLKSSTAVYGARPSNPAFLTEDAPLYGSRRYGYTRDLLEIESFCNGFRRQAPALAIAVLRFASIVGPSAGPPIDVRPIPSAAGPWRRRAVPPAATSSISATS